MARSQNVSIGGTQRRRLAGHDPNADGQVATPDRAGESDLVRLVIEQEKLRRQRDPPFEVEPHAGRRTIMNSAMTHEGSIRPGNLAATKAGAGPGRASQIPRASSCARVAHDSVGNLVDFEATFQTRVDALLSRALQHAAQFDVGSPGIVIV